MTKKNIVIMTTGLGLFAFVAAKMGWSGMLQELKTVWIALPILVALSSARMLLQTLAWSCALQTDGIHASLSQLIGARASSHGMGYLSVLGPLVSEPMRISLVGEHSAAATLIDTGVYWFSSGIFAIIGAICAVGCMATRHTGSLIAMVFTTLIGMAFIAGSKPILPALMNNLGDRAPAFLRHGAGTETAIRNFRRKHPAAVRRMFWMGIASQVLVLGEVAAIFWCLNMPIHCTMLLAIETANRLVKAAGGWVPARLGADESGMAAAFMTFGLPSASGLALALARRSRDLLEVLVGFTWLALRARSAKRPNTKLAQDRRCLRPEIGCAIL